MEIVVYLECLLLVCCLTSWFHTMDLSVEIKQWAWTHQIWIYCTDTCNSELGGTVGRQRHPSELCADSVLKETIRQVLQAHPEGVRLQDLAAVFQVSPSRCQLSEFFVSILLIIGIRYVLHVHVYVYIVSVFPRKFSMHGGSVAELVHDAM